MHLGNVKKLSLSAEDFYTDHCVNNTASVGFPSKKPTSVSVSVSVSTSMKWRDLFQGIGSRDCGDWQVQNL